MSLDDDLERAIGEWLLRKESEPDLLPGTFAQCLPPSLQEPFLRELESLAAIDGMATLAPPRDLPRRYGDFRVLGELGRGAMGAVYDAEQVSTGARVALKVMHAHVAKDLHSASRFQREARTAASLRHPGIVTVFDFGETDGAWWLAMERLEGRSLQRLLAAQADARDVDHDRAVALIGDGRRLARVLADAADALAFAHRHGVVHRDVKPANLMCCDDGRIVVLDFGLATARDPDAVTLTRTGDFLGTPLYMAPEQVVGAENGKPTSDVYSLGAVLYECLCGRPPVAPGPLATVIDSILNREPVAPRRLRPDAPDELGRVAMQCLEKEPERRYATAAAMADDLRRFVDGSGVQARSSGALGRSLRRLRRRPALAASLLVVAVLLVAVVVTWRIAVGSGQVAAARQDELDVVRIEQLLGGAPERVTVFGGASLRYYTRLGLGEGIDAGVGARSPQAGQALALAESLARRHPDDLMTLRMLACAWLDVGDDDARVDAAVAALLAHPQAGSGDRMMAAVRARQQGRDAEAELLRAAATGTDAMTAFWLGFWRQDEQDHEAAIAAFTRAIDAGDLRTELRYQALLHRGWCRTCPDIADLERAKEDLLQAAALRPTYGTARLLWAALRCLEARVPADLAEPVEAVGKVLEHAEPWVHVLTARVLLGLAEGGVVQSGPVSFGADYTPIAVMPIPGAVAQALAGTALALLDGVLARAPTAFDAAFHRVSALALLARHDEALVAADLLQAGQPVARRAMLELQRARVHLAAGSTPRAFAAVRRALELDPRLLPALRFRAELCGHVGDAKGRLDALERAIAALAERRRETAVFPDAVAQWPELQLARARTLAELGRLDAARDLLRNGNFGDALAGEFSPRVRQQRSAQLVRLGAPPLADLSPLPAGSPLQWLAAGDRQTTAADATAVRMAWRRGWLPAAALRTAGERMPWLLDDLQAAGVSVPPDVQQAPLRALLANVVALAADARTATAMLERTEKLLAADEQAGEARLLRGIVLQLTGQSAAAARVLEPLVDETADDLRARYLLAVAARDSGDQALLRLALRRGRTLVDAAELDAAAMVLPLRDVVPGGALLGSDR